MPTQFSTWQLSAK